MNEVTQLLRDINGLIKQAETEKSHYYVASVLRRCYAIIDKLSSKQG